ncbi:DUF2357 domain-containing protein [Persephonella sp. KM09-Lau-8]|uniref:DUF2357 domain-containing protein n=1 Tax=Persephonella sp. KM09-Lau-8 TaxID=1158345 RepID=UPI0009DEE94B|nr:DUF2357 domain-containing protein [Persephonella sp. KM09-Lau-8]
MNEYILHFAEKPLLLDEEDLEDTKEILEYLKKKEQIDIQENFIFFKNYTGIIETKSKNYLVIPKKLAKHFNLINEKDEPIENFEKTYDKKFEQFLKYILQKLSKEHIIYSLSLSHFPVEESKLNESSILKLLLLLNKKDELIGSFYLILTNPHRKLIEYESYKNIDEVSYVDSDVIVDIIQNPERLYETSNGIIDDQGKRYAPSTVLQYETEETFDTLENRFIKHFLKELENILLNELKDFMFLDELKELKNEVENMLQSDIFSEVGDLNYFPSNSQVLMKKSGYREIFQIYRLLHLSFVPKIFEDLDMAFSLKDMATLWEYYVLIKILKEFKEKCGNYKVEINFKEKSKYKTNYEEAKFRFKNRLILYFQKTKKSYANVEFRPDFLIEYNGKSYVFDAKFRIFKDNRPDILKNMHYYKDGLKLNSAVAVCLGEDKKGSFWVVDKTDKNDKDLFSLLEIINNEELKGIGYINLKLEM